MTDPHEHDYDGETCPVCGGEYDHYRLHYPEDDEYRTRDDATACRRSLGGDTIQVWVHR